MAFGPNGNLFVSSNFSDEVLEYDRATGNFVGTFVTFQSGGLDEPDDLTFGPDGNLYVTSFITDQVLRYNGTTGAFMNVFASGIEMDQPSELVFAKHDAGPWYLYVTSVANDHVARYNGTTGAHIDNFATAGATGLNQPRGAVFGPDGHLYVGGQNQIIRYNGTAGTYIDTYLASGSISGPSHSAFIPGHQVLVPGLVVNSTGDLGDLVLGDGVCDTGGTVGANPECTLRAAIDQANALAGADTITFNIPITDPGYSAAPVGFTIQPGVGSPLPAIGEQVSINGTTQPEYVTEGRPVIEIDGTLAGVAADGLSITAGDVTVRGLVINRFGRDGIRITGTGSNTIAGNYLGTDVTGTQPGFGNGNNGIFVISSPGNQIGGLSGDDRNVISGNGNNGLLIDGVASTGNIIQGNYVGLNAAGTAAHRQHRRRGRPQRHTGEHGGRDDPAARNVIGGQG